MPFKDKERRHEYQREWYKRDPDRARKYQATWKAKDPEHAKQMARDIAKRFYHNHPELKKIAQGRNKEWRKANPERFRELQRNAKHKRRAARFKTSVGPIDYLKITEAANGMCGICKKSLGNDIEFDHIIPLSKGGPHTQENLQATHRHCNILKGAKLPTELKSDMEHEYWAN